MKQPKNIEADRDFLREVEKSPRYHDILDSIDARLTNDPLLLAEKRRLLAIRYEVLDDIGGSVLRVEEVQHTKRNNAQVTQAFGRVYLQAKKNLEETLTDPTYAQHELFG